MSAHCTGRMAGLGEYGFHTARLASVLFYLEVSTFPFYYLVPVLLVRDLRYDTYRKSYELLVHFVIYGHELSDVLKF